MDDALRKLAQSVRVIRSLHRGTGGRDAIPVGDPRRDENLARHMAGSQTPPVLYHGTHGDIKQFKRTKGAHFGFHFGDVEAANNRLEDLADKHPWNSEDLKERDKISTGHFNNLKAFEETLRRKNAEVPHHELVSALEKGEDIGPIFKKYEYVPTEQEASQLANLHHAYKSSQFPIVKTGEGSNIGAYHVAIKNPLRMNDVGDWGSLKKIKSALPFDSDAKSHGDLINELNSRGYDGVVYSNRVENPVMKTNSYIAFHPHQIKSATGNNGQFDPTSPRINEARGGDVEGYATKGAVAGQKQYKQPFGPFQKGQLVSSEAAGPQDRPWERWVPSGYNSHEEVPIVNPQDLVGKRVGSLLADLTRAGGYYSGIDSSKIQNPEPMLGGPGYPLLPENQKHGLGWAVQGKGKGTAKLNKDFDYIAVHAMNPNSHLSNASMSNAVAKTMQAYVRDNRLSPDAVSKINDLIRSGAVNKKGEIDAKHQSLQDFPGFDHPEIQKFMKDMNFESRLKMYDILGQAKAEKLGAPSIEKIRRDTLSPQHAGDQYGSASYLLEVPRGSSDSLVNLAKSGLPIHPSYDWGVRGRVVGRFANPVSADILHKTWFDAKKEENKTKVTPKGKAPNIRRAFEMALPVTTITQEIADMLPHAPKDIQSSKAAQLALNAFNDKWGDTNTNVKQGGVGSADFARALRNSDSSSTLTQYTPEEINKMKKAGKFTGYKLKDGEVYFGLKHGTNYAKDYDFHHPDLTDNETALTSVVNNEPGAKGIGGAPVVLKALQHGATALDAYAVPTDRHPNGFLPDFYSHFGFEELGRVPFDPKYVTHDDDGNKKPLGDQHLADMKHEWAKTGWDEQRHGLPSLAIMKWRGSDADRQDAVRRFVSKGGEGFGPRTGASHVATAAELARQSAGSDIAAPQGERGNGRSEERRVGKECRSRWSPYH